MFSSVIVQCQFWNSCPQLSLCKTMEVMQGNTEIPWSVWPATMTLLIEVVCRVVWQRSLVVLLSPAKKHLFTKVTLEKRNYLLTGFLSNVHSKNVRLRILKWIGERPLIYKCRVLYISLWTFENHRVRRGRLLLVQLGSFGIEHSSENCYHLE